MWLDKIAKEIPNFRWKSSVDGEMQIGEHYVNGYDPVNEIVYQCHTCFYHGCVKCFGADNYNVVLEKRFGVLNEQTKLVTNYLKECNYTVVEKWECEYVADQRITGGNIKDAYLMFKKYFPLHMRDALYGSRICLVWL